MHHPPHNIDWDTLRIFLAVKRLRSFRGASSELGVASATVARAIDRLEDQLGFKLLIRDPDGVRLTTEGRRLSESIDNAEKAIFDVWRSAALANETLAGSIRLAVTEGLGTFWLMPRLATYIRENPRVNIELQAAMKSVDVLRFESDISIQFTEPKGKDLVVEQLGWLHLTWFASQEYIDRRGMCTSFQDLANHLIVEQQTDQLHSYRLDELFGPGSTERMMRLKTNFSSAHYWAVAKGVGIGLLPSSSAAGSSTCPPASSIRSRSSWRCIRTWQATVATGSSWAGCGTYFRLKSIPGSAKISSRLLNWTTCRWDPR